MSPDVLIIVFQFIVLIFSVVIHEVSHGYMAERLGDPTARLSGRLTLNPLKHIDPFGSVIFPLILAALRLPVFGWAVPVPYNPYNLKDPIRGGGKIAAAGPGSNFLLAVIFAGLVRLVVFFSFPVPSSLLLLFVIVVKVNVMLMVFNLVPLPPLDGSKVLFAILPSARWSNEVMGFLERYGFFLVIAFIFFGFDIIQPVMDWLFLALLGLPTGI